MNDLPERPHVEDARARISVIIPNYNGLPHLPECLESVAAQDLSEHFTTILVDDASADGSVEWVRAHHPTVRILEMPKNLGFGAAVNRGAAATGTEYIVALNNDVRVPKDWLRRLVEAADHAPDDVLSIGSRIFLYDNPTLLNHRQTKVSPIGGGFDVGFGERAGDEPENAAPYETGAGCGGAVLYRRGPFEALGGFDESFFMYFEDVDLGLRGWLNGFRSLVVPQSVVFHKLGATAGGLTSPIKLYWGHRNQVRIMIKAFSLRRLVVAVPFLAASIALKVLDQLARRNQNGASQILSGLRDGFRDIDELRAERRAIQEGRSLSDGALVQHGVFATPGDLFKEYTRLRALRAKGFDK